MQPPLPSRKKYNYHISSPAIHGGFFIISAYLEKTGAYLTKVNNYTVINSLSTTC